MGIRMALAVTAYLMSPIAAIAQSIESDWDRAYDFSKLRTYAYLPQTRGPNDPLSVNPLNDRRVRAALDSQLVAHGFTQSSDAPDFLIAYHATTRNKVNVQDWGYGPGHWGPRHIDVNQSTEGSLIVDFVSGANKELLWRGSATGTISPSEADKKIRNAVTKLVQRFVKDTKARK
jgi:hypothetical protein